MPAGETPVRQRVFFFIIFYFFVSSSLSPLMVLDFFFRLSLFLFFFYPLVPNGPRDREPNDRNVVGGTASKKWRRDELTRVPASTSSPTASLTPVNQEACRGRWCPRFVRPIFLLEQMKHNGRRDGGTEGGRKQKKSAVSEAAEAAACAVGRTPSRGSRRRSCSDRCVAAVGVGVAAMLLQAARGAEEVARRGMFLSGGDTDGG